MSVPFPVLRCLRSSVVGFSGSRSLGAGVSVSVLRSCVSALGSGRVFVGCASGVDSFFRSSVASSRLSVFRVVGSGRGAFASRSVRFVSALASARGVLVSFPGRACPAGLLPSACSRSCFCGLGSGSWASLALAVGLGVPCCVWLPVGLSVPSAWRFVAVGGGWWVSW